MFSTLFFSDFINLLILLLEPQLISASLSEETDSSLDSDEKLNDKSSLNSNFEELSFPISHCTLLSFGLICSSKISVSKLM